MTLIATNNIYVRTVGEDGAVRPTRFLRQGTGGKQILLEDPSGNLVELFEANTAAYRAPGAGSQGDNH